MKEFNDLQKDWLLNQMDINDLPNFLKKKVSNPILLMKKQYLLSAIGSLATSVFILWFGFFSGKEFLFEISYMALAILAICLFVIMFLNIYFWILISKFDETLPPKTYLNHWLNFYKKRLWFFRVFTPIVSIILCLSFSLYVPEIIGYYPNTFYKIGIIFFLILIYFLSYLMGKKTTREEKAKLNELNHVFQLLSRAN